MWGPTPPQLVRAVLVPDPPVLARLRWPPSLAAASLELLALASVAPAPREQRQPGSGIEVPRMIPEDVEGKGVDTGERKDPGWVGPEDVVLEENKL